MGARTSIAAAALVALTPMSVAAQELELPGLFPPAIEEDLAPETPGDGAVMQGLDKVTARISTFDAPVGFPIRFGTLEIVRLFLVSR